MASPANIDTSNAAEGKTRDNGNSMRRLAIVNCVLAILLIFGAWAWRRQHTQHLETVQVWIEKHYAMEIQAIETSIDSLDPERANYDWGYVYEEGQKLKPMFDKPEIFSVTWSSDGHHGLSAIISPESAGWQTYYNTYFRDWRQPMRKVCGGRTLEGKSLYCYIVWLPHAPVQREYKIYFLADPLDEQIELEQ
jgi:hypothetical protein